VTSLLPLLSKLSHRKQADISNLSRKHNYRGVLPNSPLRHTHTHRPATLATGASWCGSLSLTCRGNTMSCCALPVFLSAAWMVTAPAGQHPFSPYPGGGGETVGAASERRRERCAGTSLLTPFFTDSSSRACIGKSPSFFHSCRDCDENSQRGLNLWQGACGRGADARRACLASPEDWPEACG
jgi:hypothetical protein